LSICDDTMSLLRNPRSSGLGTHGSDRMRGRVEAASVKRRNHSCTNQARPSLPALRSRDVKERCRVAEQCVRPGRHRAGVAWFSPGSYPRGKISGCETLSDWSSSWYCVDTSVSKYVTFEARIRCTRAVAEYPDVASLPGATGW